MDNPILIPNLKTYDEIQEKLRQEVLKKVKTHIIQRFSWILPEETSKILHDSSLSLKEQQAKFDGAQQIIDDGEWKERIEFPYTSFSIFSYPIESIYSYPQRGAYEHAPTFSGRVVYKILPRNLEGYVSFNFNLGLTLNQEMGLSLCIFQQTHSDFDFKTLPEIEDLNQSIIATFVNGRLAPPNPNNGISFWFSREADFKMMNALTGFNMLQGLTQAKRVCKREAARINIRAFTGKDKERSKARIDYYHFNELAPGLIEELRKAIKASKKDLSEINLHKIIYNFCEKAVSKVYKKHNLGV